LPYVFDRFYRVDHARTHLKDPGGSGLGLTIAQRIAHNHGGEITVSSDPETGTRFAVRLPIASNAVIKANLDSIE
jgi:signal transduction histidine kinase